MTKLRVFLLSFLIFGFAHSQILNDLKGKVKQSATNNASDFNTSRSNKEKNLNKSTEASGGSLSTDDDIKEDEGDSTNMKENDVPKIQDEYKFELRAVFSMHNLGDNTATDSEFYMSEGAYVICSDNTFMIHDFQGQQLIVADSSSKTASVSTTQEIAEMDVDMSSMLQKTGESKQLMGMTAYKFNFFTPNTVVWITESAPLTETERLAYRKFEQTVFGFKYSLISGMNGIMVGFQTYDENMMLNTDFNLKELNKKTRIINLRGYQVSGN